MQTAPNALKQLNWRRALWLPALILLFNPYLEGFDILPDAVGYALLIAALRRVALVDESFAEATRLFRRLAWLSVARLLAQMWIIAVPSGEEQPTLVLLLCFVAGILELLLVLPACHQLFRGLAYVGSRMGGEAVLASSSHEKLRRLRIKLERLSETDPQTSARRAALERQMSRVRHGGDLTDRNCFACQAFAVIKTALCVLPELSALTDASYRAGATLFNWYAYVGGFRAIAVTAGLAVGIGWLIHMVRYCLFIESDIALWQTLAARCDEDDAAHPERLPAKHLHTAVLLTVAALAFCTNFSIENVNVLPGFLTPLLFLAALLTLRRYLPRMLTLASSGVFLLHAVASGVAYIMSLGFYDDYDLFAYFRNAAVQKAYDDVCIASAVEAALAWASFVALACVAMALIRRYTGGHGAATFHYTKEEIIRIRQRQLGLYLMPVLALGMLSAAAHAACCFLLPYYDFVWMPDVAISLLLLLFGWLRLHDLTEELDAHSMVPAGKSRLETD